MFANRLQKNLKTLGKWAKKAGIECYRLYDADMPEYALAVDLYRDWVHVQEYAPPRSDRPGQGPGAPARRPGGDPGGAGHTRPTKW